MTNKYVFREFGELAQSKEVEQDNQGVASNEIGGSETNGSEEE